MQYEEIWNKVLNSNEKVEYEFSVGDKYIKLGLIVWGIISLPLLFAVGFGIITFLIALFYYAFYLKKANAYAFTNTRVLIHRGWLSTKARSVNYDKITEVSVVEPFLSRIVTKTGNLTIHTANVTDALVLTNISSPYEVKKKLDSLRNTHSA